MKTVVISPYAKPLRSPGENPKNFPYFDELTRYLKAKGLYIIQVGTPEEKRLSNIDEMIATATFSEIEDLVRSKCDFFISVDNFLHHLGYHVGKRGVVIWSRSDPQLFGYPFHVNILKERSCLREDQFGLWEDDTFDPETFMHVDQIRDIIFEQFNL